MKTTSVLIWILRQDYVLFYLFWSLIDLTGLSSSHGDLTGVCVFFPSFPPSPALLLCWSFLCPVLFFFLFFSSDGSSHVATTKALLIFQVEWLLLSEK